MIQPRTFEEAVKILRLDASLKIITPHRSRHYRNLWGLWYNKTPLARWFTSKEIYNGDDRWEALIEATHNRDFNIDEFSKRKQLWWVEQYGDDFSPEKMKESFFKDNPEPQPFVLTFEKATEILHAATSIVPRPDGSMNVSWEELNDFQKNNAVSAVKELLLERLHTPEEHHNLWLRPMIEQGWKQGEYSLEDKTHPCVCSYEELPDSEKLKDYIWMHMVEAFRPFIKDFSNSNNEEE